MKVRTAKVLRDVAKVALLLCIFLLLGLGIYYTYLSIRFRPYKVRVSNVTDSAFTVSWITDKPMEGVVYYGDNSVFLPGPLSWLGKKVAFDDRDISDAQTECVDRFAKEVSKTKDKDFTVDITGFDCNDVKVKKVGKYYTHHVTVDDLEPNKEYYFRVGTKVVTYAKNKGTYTNNELTGIEKFSTTTRDIFTELGTPRPAFGVTYNLYYDDGKNLVKNISFDSLMFLLAKRDDEVLGYFSGVANNDGGWSIDMGNIRDAKGNVIKETEGIELEFIPQTENFLPANRKKVSLSDVEFPLLMVGNNHDTWENPKEEKQGNIPTEKSILGVFKHNASAQSSNCSWLYRSSSGTCECLDSDNGYSTEEACLAKGVDNDKDEMIVGKESRECFDEDGCVCLFDKQGNNYMIRIDIDIGEKCTPKTVCKAADRYPGKLDIQMGEMCIDPSGCECFNGGTYAGVNAECGCECGGECAEDEGGGEPEDEPEDEPLIPYKIEKKGGDFKCVAVEEGTQCCDNKGDNKGCPKLKPIGEGDVFCDKTTCEVFLSSLGWSSECGKGLAYRKVRLVVRGKETVKEVGLNDENGKSFDSHCNTPSLRDVPFNPSLGYYIKGDLNSLKKGALYCPSVDSGGILIGIELGEGHYSPTPDSRLGYADYFHEYKCCAYKDMNAGTARAVDRYLVATDCQKYKKSNEELVAGGGVDYVYNCDYRIKDSYCLMPDDKSPNDITKIGFAAVLTAHPSGTYNQYTTAEACEAAAKKNKVTLVPITNNNKSGFNSKDIVKYNSEELSCCKAPEGGVKILADCKKKNREEWGKCYNASTRIAPLYTNTQSDGVLGIETSVLGSATNPLGNDTVGVLFSPESGLYEVNYLGDKFNIIGTEGVSYFFYRERNGEEGYQPPLDPLNPKEDEDIMLPKTYSGISLSKIANKYELELKQGVNIISFNFLPTKGGDEMKLTSGDFLKLVNTSGKNVSSISYFSGGQWQGGTSYDFGKQEVKGVSFDLVFGKGYVVIAEEDVTITVPGHDLKSSVPIALSSGWNLVGIHGHKRRYTAKSLINSVNSIEGLKANNVTFWPTNRGMYQGYQLSEGQAYGQDFPISKDLGYFIRINEFNPKQTGCKSILWNPGGQRNGECGTELN